MCSVFDRLTLFTIDDSHRSIVAFLDNHRLRMGEQIQGDLVKAVRNSRIFMPVVSADALARMKQHDPSIVDNVLLEWIIALNCHKHPVCRLSKVFPVLFGSRKDGAVGSLFTEKAIDELPDYSPDATIDLARALLREQGVSVKEDLICLSVKDVLNRMLQFMCTLGWKYTENAQLIAHVTQSLVNSLAEPEVSDAMFDAAPPAAAFTAEAVKQIENKPAIGDAQLTVHYHKESTPLETLTVEEVGYLMANIDLSMYIDDFAANRVDGEVLALSESVDDLKEGESCLCCILVVQSFVIFIFAAVGVLKGIHAKKILKMTAEMKMSGVPRFRLVKP